MVDCRRKVCGVWEGKKISDFLEAGCSFGFLKGRSVVFSDNFFGRSSWLKAVEVQRQYINLH